MEMLSGSGGLSGMQWTIEVSHGQTNISGHVWFPKAKMIPPALKTLTGRLAAEQLFRQCTSCIEPCVHPRDQAPC